MFTNSVITLDQEVSFDFVKSLGHHLCLSLIKVELVWELEPGFSVVKTLFLINRWYVNT